MEQSNFLLLIADEVENKVFASIPTTIKTEDEGILSAESFIKEHLTDSSISLANGRYIGIIVRKSFYDKLDKKDDVPTIFRNNDVYVSSKVIIITDDETKVI